MKHEDVNQRIKIINAINDIQEEILSIGWQGIMQKYHPEVAMDDPDAIDRFKLYKNIYENMRERIKIEDYMEV